MTDNFQPFFGQRRALLASLWLNYIEHRDGDGGRDAADVYAKLVIIPTFMEKFPWWLPEDVDPVPGVTYRESDLEISVRRTRIEVWDKICDKIITWLDYNWARHRITHRILNFEGAFGVRFCEHDHGAPCRFYGPRRAIAVDESVNPPAHIPHIRNDTNY